MNHDSQAPRSETMDELVRALDGGPLTRLQTSLGLIRPADLRIKFRIAIAVLIGWVPLALLSLAQGYALRPDPNESFLLDFGAHSRFFVAIPLLLAAEATSGPPLKEIIWHFLKTGLVRDADRSRFEEIVASGARLSTSPSAGLLIVLLSYVHIFLLSGALRLDARGSTWWAPIPEGGRVFTLAGAWRYLVSYPIFLTLYYGWLWRLLLWARFLWQVSRLKLRLNAAHPDLAGGLRFLGTSLSVFPILAFAMSSSVAGTIGNLVVHEGRPPLEFLPIFIILLALMLLLFVGPLLFFSDNLYRVKVDGTFRYGGLADGMGQQFEQKWLGREKIIDEEALSVPDFSATVDLYGVASNVQQMRLFPFDLKDLYPLLVAALLPFLPILLTRIPLKEILSTLVKVMI
jgi:hypothetical protein